MPRRRCGEGGNGGRGEGWGWRQLEQRQRRGGNGEAWRAAAGGETPEPKEAGESGKRAGGSPNMKW